MRQRCRDSQDFGGSPKNRGAALLFGFALAERPGMLGGQIFVRCGDERPNLFQRERESQFVVLLEDFSDRLLRFRGQRGVLRLKRGWLGNFSAAVLLDHRGGAAGEVAEAVGEVAVVALDEGVVTEIAVLAEDGFAQKIVAKRVHTEDVNDGPRANDVAK